MFELWIIGIIDEIFGYNLEKVMYLIDFDVDVWELKFSFLVFVYENLIYDVVVYLCFKMVIYRKWCNIM